MVNHIDRFSSFNDWDEYMKTLTWQSPTTDPGNWNDLDRLDRTEFARSKKNIKKNYFKKIACTRYALFS